MIRCMKRCLRRLLGHSRILTLLKEIKNVLNNHLLTVIYYDELIQPLTAQKNQGSLFNLLFKLP